MLHANFCVAQQRASQVVESAMAEDASEEAIFGDQPLSDSDDSDSGAGSDSDEDERPSFGPNGEVLDESGNPVVEVNAQPQHFQAPAADADVEIKAVHNDLVGHGGVYVTLQRARVKCICCNGAATLAHPSCSFSASCLFKRITFRFCWGHTFAERTFSSICTFRKPKY
jgi:hypothetical protein